MSIIHEWETPSGRFREWTETSTIECLNNGVWQSIPEVAQAEIRRLWAEQSANHKIFSDVVAAIRARPS